MSTELIINASLPETRIALMEGGEIQELLIERASGKGIVGNIYKGRVTRVLPGMQAAFVDIGLEKAAFLYVDDVYVHSEIWEEEEGGSENNPLTEVQAAESGSSVEPAEAVDAAANPSASSESEPTSEAMSSEEVESSEVGELSTTEIIDDDEGEEDDEDEDHRPTEMGPEGSDHSDDSKDSVGNREQPVGTVSPEKSNETSVKTSDAVGSGEAPGNRDEGQGPHGNNSRRRHRRGRRGGRYRRRPENRNDQRNYPESYHEQVQDEGNLDSDRSALDVQTQNRASAGSEGAEAGRPEPLATGDAPAERYNQPNDRREFRVQRSRDRRIRPKTSSRPPRTQVNIQDLLKEGQEVLVQVAKDPIATKGARLTCHISLPGRHLVCMPTIDHVGVSRRIEREDERRRLREFVERNRPRNLGFIVRTASGKQHERRIKQDIDYLTRLWNEIRERASQVTAPALVYEDLNAVLRAIRDWVNEDIDKIIVDSRYHFNEIQRFVSHFMPPLKHKVELYHGDIPIFDAYNISTELSRALERKVWLKSGGYIVIDQAEALVAIDVNTGRYVGKKNLEDTILKTNLEAVQEIAYQLRLRNCGGIIILDLIDMEKEENKQRVYRALEDALKKDRARPTILKISELGLVEMTRKRTRDTIIRTLCESCTHCEGKGFIKSKQTVAYEVMREMEREGIERDVGKILVQAHPDVIDFLAIEERETLDQIERRYRKQVYLQAVGDFHPEQFEVIADKRDRKDAGTAYNERNRRERSSSRHGSYGGGGGGGNRHDGGSYTPVVAAAETSEASSMETQSESTMQPQEASSAEPPQSTPAENALPPEASGAGGSSLDDGFYDEEDRLAFLRAQAAQDAALARLGGAGHASGSGSMGHPRANGGGRSGENRDRDNRRGGRRNNRRGGGKFRGGRGGGGGGDRDRGPRQFGVRTESVNRGEITPNSGPAPVTPAATPATTTQTDTSGSSTPTGGSGGPGDHSQPPV